MKKILFLFTFLAIVSCDRTDPDNPHDAKFNNRGCLECDNYTANERFTLQGESYLVADRSMLILAVADGHTLNKYCTSKVTDMSSLFTNSDLNQDISNWDVSNVTTMRSMFHNATSFNQDISNWDVANVFSMNSMFRDATVFNQDLSNWCVSDIMAIPQNFSINSALTESNHPIWGTCP